MKLAALVIGVFSAFVITAAAFGIGGGPLMAAVNVDITQRGTLNGPKSPGYLTFNMPNGCVQVEKPSQREDGALQLPCVDTHGVRYYIIIHHPFRLQSATITVKPEN